MPLDQQKKFYSLLLYSQITFYFLLLYWQIILSIFFIGQITVSNVFWRKLWGSFNWLGQLFFNCGGTRATKLETTSWSSCPFFSNLWTRQNCPRFNRMSAAKSFVHFLQQFNCDQWGGSSVLFVKKVQRCNESLPKCIENKWVMLYCSCRAHPLSHSWEWSHITGNGLATD